VTVSTGSIDSERIDPVRLLNPEALLSRPIVLDGLFRGPGIDLG
jgi:hypothetical protein